MSHARNRIRLDHEGRHDARAGGPRATAEPRSDASLRARTPAGSEQTAVVDRPCARPMGAVPSRDLTTGVRS